MKSEEKIMLKRLLTHACNNVPYYKKKINSETVECLSDETWNSIPVLTKNEVRKCGDELLSENVNLSELKQEVTSGSTGIPLTIYKSCMDELCAGKQMWKIRTQVYGIRPNDRWCRFCNLRMKNANSEYKKVEVNKHEIKLSSVDFSDEDIQEYYNVLCEEQPKWIFGPPSGLFIIANYLLEHLLPKIESIKYIEITGEYHTEEMRQTIKKAFGCEVASMYGLRESYGVAIQCPDGKMHLLDKNVYFDVLNEKGEPVGDGESGKIFITTLNNTAMPFIKYETGDLGRVYRNYTCKCGLDSPIIELESGRTSDFVMLENNRKLNAAIFAQIVMNINYKFSNSNSLIAQFQVEQSSLNEFNVYFCVNANEQEKEYIKAEFLYLANKGIQEGLTWNLEFVDKILPSEKTGKTKNFIRNIE